MDLFLELCFDLSYFEIGGSVLAWLNFPAHAPRSLGLCSNVRTRDSRFAAFYCIFGSYAKISSRDWYFPLFKLVEYHSHQNILSSVLIRVEFNTYR